MASEINSNSIFDLIINSSESLEKALNFSEGVKQQISDILDYRPVPDEKFSDRLETTADDLDIRHLFDIAHEHIQGFAVASNTVEANSCYQALLQRSLTVCNDVLTPLLVSSFKYHQTALAHYVNAGQPDESARAAMAKTGKIAQTISKEYKQLSDEFLTLIDKVNETMVAATTEQLPFYEREREGTDDSKEKQTLQASISSLDLVINSLRKIQAQLNNVKLSLDLISLTRCKPLTKPILANFGYIKLLGREISEGEEKLYIDFKIMEIMVRAASAEQPSNLTEVVQSMKTGHNTVKSCPPSTAITDSVKAARFGSINQEFEKSYLNWLALAKVNQVMTTALKEIIRMMEIL